MERSSDVPGTAENGKNVRMKLKPDRVDGVYARATNVIPLAAVNPRHAIGEPADVILVPRYDRHDVAHRLNQTFDNSKDLCLRLFVLVVLLPIADRFDELIVQRLEAVVPNVNRGILAELPVEPCIEFVYRHGALRHDQIPPVDAHRPTLFNRGGKLLLRDFGWHAARRRNVVRGRHLLEVRAIQDQERRVFISGRHAAEPYVQNDSQVERGLVRSAPEISYFQ